MIQVNLFQKSLVCQLKLSYLIMSEEDWNLVYLLVVKAKLALGLIEIWPRSKTKQKHIYDIISWHWKLHILFVCFFFVRKYVPICADSANRTWQTRNITRRMKKKTKITFNLWFFCAFACVCAFNDSVFILYAQTELFFIYGTV